MLFAGVNWGWHFSTLYDQALENPPLHYLQHATFLVAALLFWWPVVGADPGRWRLPYPVRLFYLFLAMPQNSFLGVALMSAPVVLYQHYLTNLRDWGPTAIADQNLGGILMWVFGDVVFLMAMGAWSRPGRATRIGAPRAWMHGSTPSRPAAKAGDGLDRQAQQAVNGDRREQQRQVADREAEEADGGAPGRHVRAAHAGALPDEGGAQHDGADQVDQPHLRGREEQQADRDQQQRVEHDLARGLGLAADDRQHRHVRRRVVVLVAQRQRPEVGRRPVEDDARTARAPASPTEPVTAAQPTSTGTQPAAPPMTMFCGVVRLSHSV